MASGYSQDILRLCLIASVIFSIFAKTSPPVLWRWKVFISSSFIDDLPDTKEKVAHKKVFNEMSGKLKDPEHRTRYGTIQSWFVKTFPTYKDYSPIDAIVARARKKAEPTALTTQF